MAGRKLLVGHMQKKILFISYDGMTDPLGQSQVIPYLQGLSKRGFQFFLLSCEKQEAFARNEAAGKAMLAGYNIEWVPIPYTKKPPVLSTLKDIINLRKQAKKFISNMALIWCIPGRVYRTGRFMDEANNGCKIPA